MKFYTQEELDASCADEREFLIKQVERLVAAIKKYRGTFDPVGQCAWDEHDLLEVRRRRGVHLDHEVDAVLKKIRARKEQP